MRNYVSVAGNGLSGGAHPGTDSCAMGGGCVVVCVLCDMRGIAPMHGPHDKEQHQAEGNCQTFSMCHVINLSTLTTNQKRLKDNK
jgi:hypothetical protein